MLVKLTEIRPRGSGVPKNPTRDLHIDIKSVLIRLRTALPIVMYAQSVLQANREVDAGIDNASTSYETDHPPILKVKTEYLCSM